MIITTPEDSPIMRELLAKNAADAGRKNREACIREARLAYLHDADEARRVMARYWPVTPEIIAEARTAHEACLSYLDDIERHLTHNLRRSTDQSDGPDVALPVGGRGL